MDSTFCDAGSVECVNMILVNNKAGDKGLTINTQFKAIRLPGNKTPQQGRQSPGLKPPG